MAGSPAEAEAAEAAARGEPRSALAQVTSIPINDERGPSCPLLLSCSSWWCSSSCFLLFGVVGFNKLRKADITAQESLGGIDVQLTRRADLIPNLVNTVRATPPTRAVSSRRSPGPAAPSRRPHRTAPSNRGRRRPGPHRSAGPTVRGRRELPDLKASANFIQLQNELSDTENKLSFARQYYNDAVSRLNKLVQTIPWMFFSGVAG